MLHETLKKVQDSITSGLVSEVYDTIIDEVQVTNEGLVFKVFNADMSGYNVSVVTYYSFIHEMRMYILSKSFDMSLDIFVDNDGDNTIRYQVKLDRIERFEHSMWTSIGINELFLSLSELEVMVSAVKWVANYSKYSDD